MAVLLFFFDILNSLYDSGRVNVNEIVYFSVDRWILENSDGGEDLNGVVRLLVNGRALISCDRGENIDVVVYLP